MENKTRKFNIPIRVAIILLILIFTSAYSMSGLYARYLTNESATDSAKVAKFNPTVTYSGTKNIMLDTETSIVQTNVFSEASYIGEWIISFESNNTEVSYEIDVIIISESTIDSKFHFQIVKSGVTTPIQPTSRASNSVTFSSVGDNSSTSMILQCGIYVTDVESLTDELSFDFDVKIVFRQID